MVSMNEKETHILMVTPSLPGHLNPMVHLAERLASTKIHVTIAVAEMSGFSPAATSNPLIHFEFFSDGFGPDVHRFNCIKAWIDSMKTTGVKNVSNLITSLRTRMNIVCIINNPFIPWIVDVAFEHQIPCAVLWVQACAVYSILYRYYNKTDSFPSFEKQEQTVKLHGLPAIEVRDLPSMMIPNEPHDEMMRDFFKSLDKVKWVLGSSFYELEEEIVKSMDLLKPIIPIGPLVSPFLLGYEAENSVKHYDFCIAWLDTKPPSSVIYISFGSITTFTQTQIESVATALKNTNKLFLWVIKDFDKDSLEGVVMPEFLDEEVKKERGLIVSWCSQERVLMHNSLACFMTHGGWNSTLETVVAGLPVIVYPSRADQYVDAKLLADVFKIGVRMRNCDQVAEVEKCLVEVTEGMTSIKMKKKAEELKENARRVLEHGGSSSKNLDRFINELFA